MLRQYSNMPTIPLDFHGSCAGRSLVPACKQFYQHKLYSDNCPEARSIRPSPLLRRDSMVQGLALGLGLAGALLLSAIVAVAIMVVRSRRRQVRYLNEAMNDVHDQNTV